VGLEAVVGHFHPQGLGEEGPGLEFARQIIHQLTLALQEEGRNRYLDACLDGVDRFSMETKDHTGWPLLPRVAGLTAWTPATPIRQQVRIAGNLHATTRNGTAAILVSTQAPVSPEEAAAVIGLAWQAEVTRLRFVRLTPLAEESGGLWAE